ncbi:MAG: excinuclease ABC subunit UvrA [Pseudomonadota bacterium]
MATIDIRGARTHNLKNIDVELPREKLIVLTGLSGSGKSSLAFDTIYAEGQRRYVESLSTYARQFLSMMDKPDVDHIDGLSPAISIEQKSTSHNPRSTVGTVTEIYDYLRLLYARAGTPRCPDHGQDLEAQTISQMVDHVMALESETRLMLVAPLVTDRKGSQKELLSELRAQGFVRARIDGSVHELSATTELDGKTRHSVDVVVDRFKVRDGLEQRLAESFETALTLGDGVARIASIDTDEIEFTFSDKYACKLCGYSLSELEPRLFSFNSPVGACPTCDGLGSRSFFDPDRVVVNDEISLAGGAIRGWDRKTTYYFQMIGNLARHYDFDIETPFRELSEAQRQAVLYGSGEEVIDFSYTNTRGAEISQSHPFEGVVPNLERRYRETDSGTVREELSRFLSQQSCPDCKGSRLNAAARHVFVGTKNLPEVASLSVAMARAHVESLSLGGWRAEIVNRVVKEIGERLRFLDDVGLSYLSLSRSAETLSGGEAQRIRLASQIGSGLVGVMYVLDEPSIGLHQRDNERLLETLKHLRNLGNTVIVVEHDEEAILGADHVVDLGPGAGVHGGQIVAQGTPEQIMASTESLTGQYLSGTLKIAIPEERRQFDKNRTLHLAGATGNNLDNLTVDIPIGLLTVVAGVSGSGKSTLINDTLFQSVAARVNRSPRSHAPFTELRGAELIDRVIEISQSPIGRTPRSNPATYSGLFTPIRELFAETQEARTRGYAPGRFSFNVKGGRCEPCQGDGLIKVEMHFLPDVYVACDVCGGKRYNRETLEVRYKGRNIFEVLDMTVEDALVFFANVPVLKKKLDTLAEVGLQYIRLGQNATTLSGGEAQRIKLARELSKRDTGSTLYVLDEPTTGLHFHDVAQLLRVLDRLTERGNTVVVIEHNMDVIKYADWLLELGPEGGDGGGKIVATGTPETVAKIKSSPTGAYLETLLSRA